MREATLLTVDVKADPLADSGRDVIPGDAEVGPHLGPGYSSDGQVLALVLLLASLVPGGAPDDVLAVLESWVNILPRNCQAQVQSPNVQIPVKGLGMTQ